MYTKKEVLKSSLEYFNQDNLAANVFLNKYCLKDKDGHYLELNPDDMHKRIADEFSRIEQNFAERREGAASKPELTYDKIYEYIIFVIDL